MERLKKNGVKINFEKSRFFQHSISYLGHILENGTVRADLSDFNSAKIKKVPENRKQLMSLLGYVNWYRPFLPRLSEMVSPLYDKLKKKDWRWRKEDEEVIQKIEAMIMSEQRLALPNLEDSFELHTDASEVAVSGILTQRNRIVRIYSAKLSPSQEKYSIVEKDYYQ